MKLSSNIIKFHDELGIKRTIDVFAEAGFDGIDFNADLAEYYDDTHNEEFYKNIKAYANGKGMVFFQAHAPISSYFVDEEKSKQRKVDIIKSMQHSAWLGAEMIVIHPCKHIDYRDNKYDFMMEFNYNFYKSFVPYAEEFGIKIAIENIESVTQTPEGLLELLGALDNDVFTICYDVGHANIQGQDPVEMLRKLGNRIGCTHIHDNNGVSDSHTLPYYGNIDWEGIMKAFAEVGYTGNLNYEAGLFVRRAPVILREESAKYMVSIGRQLIDRYWYYKNHL